MSLWDWLLAPPSDFHPDPERRSKSGATERAPWGDLLCTMCQRSLTRFGAGHCRCDPELGRPRRWFE